MEAKNFFQYNKEDFGESIRKRINVITLDFLKLTEFSNNLSDKILVNPEETLKLMEIAFEEIGLVKNARIMLTNISQSIDIHQIRAKNIGEIFNVKGTIKRITKVIPRTINIKYSCPTCGTTISVIQRTRKRIEPRICACGRKGGFKVESEEIKNIQELNLEEIQENLEGKQPQQLRVYLEDELTDGSLCSRLQPGRRVEVVGIIKKLPTFMNKDDSDSNLSEFMVYANNIIPSDTEDDLTITDEDIKTIREISLNNPLEKLSKSLVPEVYGNDMVKKAVCLQCVKGVGKERSDGSYSQEDINILITGDVGVSKSVTLKATTTRTPRARMIVGTKTSKTSLGAMAIKDELTDTWSLQCGPLVMASGSTLCLDELDKMYKENLSELLEPMSVSTVTIAKAGINATLPARVSILASANPIHGNYDLSQPLAKQIDLPTPILNRFDLIFILLDRPNEEFDSKAVEHIFKSYKEKMEPEIPITLFKKYITYCRKLKPVIDEGLVNYVQDFYVNIRAKSRSPDMMTIPVNLRNMEAVVKLAEAHAKLRLSEKVEVLDLNVAKEIFMFCVKQLGVDEDTGVFDMSRLSQKLPLSKRGKLERFFEIINRLSETTEEMRYGILLEEAEKLNIKSWEVNMFLEELQKEMKIFEPRKGFFKVVKK